MRSKEILAVLAKRANQFDSEGRFAEADTITRKMVKVSGFGDDQRMLDSWLRTDRDPELMQHNRRRHKDNDDPLSQFLDPLGDRSKQDDSASYEMSNGQDLGSYDDDDALNDADLGYDDEQDDPNDDMNMDPYNTKGKDWMMASNRQQIKKAKQEAINKLARFANKLDSEGRFAEADLVTHKLIKLASGNCMECGHDGSRSPVSKYVLDINGTKSNETLCQKCLGKAKKGGYKVVSVLEQVAAPSEEDRKAREQLNELNKQYRQERGEYWSPGGSAPTEKNILSPNWGGKVVEEEEYPDGRMNDPRYRHLHQT